MTREVLDLAGDAVKFRDPSDGHVRRAVLFDVTHSAGSDRYLIGAEAAMLSGYKLWQQGVLAQNDAAK